MLDKIKSFFDTAASLVTGGGHSSVFNAVSGRGLLGAGLGFGIAKLALDWSTPMSLGAAVAGYAAAHYLPTLFGKGGERTPAPAPTAPAPAPAPAGPAPQ